MEQPLTYWVPSIAPSGMAFLTSDRYPGWKGSLFVGALRAAGCWCASRSMAARWSARSACSPTVNERIRDVRQGPDGWLYLLTDSSNGRILRLER